MPSATKRLHDAVSCGDLHRMKQILSGGKANVNTKNDAGATVVHVAVERGRVAALKALLAVRGVDVNAKTTNGWTAIHFAARHSDPDVLKALLSAHGVDVNVKATDHGWTAIHFAARNSDPDTLKVLLSAHGVDVNAKNTEGWVALHLAAHNGRTDALKLLIANGADVNVKATDHGWAAIHLAARHSDPDTLKVLLSANGVDVNAKDTGGWAALHRAAEKGHVDTLEVLLAADGVDVNAVNTDGWAALHLAAQSGHADAVKLLIANGADINLRNVGGKTAADVASHDCAAFFEEVSRHPVSSLYRRLHTTEHQLSDSKRLVDSLTQQLEEATRAVHKTDGAADAALTALSQEVGIVMDGWASPVADPTGEAHQAIDSFVEAREALSTSLAEAAAAAVDPSVIARHRADCCAAATVLLEHLPLLSTDKGIAAAVPRPPPALVSELVEVVSAAKRTRTAALADVQRAVSACSEWGTIAEVIRAAMAADAACAPHVGIVRAKLSAARAAAAAPAPALSVEECRHHRSGAEVVLEAEGPWAGDEGLQRRSAAITTGCEIVARRATAQRTFGRKEKLLAVAKAAFAVFSGNDSDDDDDGSVETARAALRKAESEHATALPPMLAATAAVQEWATSGEGALALKAFPGDVELTAALAELFEAEFTAHTELPRTPGVRLEVEYPTGLVESPATLVFYANRACGNHTVPVVLRRLRLSSPGLVQEAQRQLQDAGRIATGLQIFPDATAECPPVVKATRWFLATAPGGSTADAWLEFPRAEFGSLAEALANGRVFSATAATDLCTRLARAVAQLHAAGIRHGDLNPSNVVLWDDPASDVVRPGIIDLLDTAVVGATRTLRGATLEWLPPEAAEAVAAGAKAYGTRTLDSWQLGRVCEAVLDAAAALPDQLQPVRAAAAALCVAEPVARSTAAAALLAMEAAVAGASAAAMTASVSLQWALPPEHWVCHRGAAPGVDFVTLNASTSAAASALTACAAGVGRRVRSVHRLENLRLWHVYAAERVRVVEEAQGASWPHRLAAEVAQTFAASNGRDALAQQDSPEGGEALLLHGAPERSLRLIAEGGLDPSYSGGRVGAVFGAATCLTPSWAKAANEYARGAGSGVFVTRAAVGCVADCLVTPRHETSQYRRPPDGHHSVLGDNGTPGAVVAVYRPSRMYPEYLVVFDN